MGISTYLLGIYAYLTLCMVNAIVQPGRRLAGAIHYGYASAHHAHPHPKEFMMT